MRRYLCVQFPDWSMTRFLRAQSRTAPSAAPPEAEPLEAAPFALVEKGAHGLRLVAANAAATAAGLGPGLAFKDARARVPELRHAPADREADARDLAALARWMVRFAPAVSVYDRSTLMLEVTGCAHLHGGEAGMMDEVARVLARENLPGRTGLAGTPLCAYGTALVQGGPDAAGKGAAIVAPGGERVAMAGHPVHVLRVSDEALTLLRRFGLNRVGQLYGIDRKALARRFRSAARAEAVGMQLDRALGLRPDPVLPLRPPAPFEARLLCPEPVASSEAVALGLEQLAGRLCADLKSKGRGGRVFALTAFRSDGTRSRIGVNASHPANDPAQLLRLFAERLDGLDPGFGIDLLLLEARRAEPMEAGAAVLSGDLAASDTDIAALSALADRLTAKLGEGRVQVPALRESHMPERAESRRIFSGQLAALAPRHPAPGPRPVRMLPVPELIRVVAAIPDGLPALFVWRRVTHRISRADGPERLNPEWWRHSSAPAPAPSPKGARRAWLTPKGDPRADAAQMDAGRADLLAGLEEDAGRPPGAMPRARDYYRVEDIAGRRFWIYREGRHGDGRGGAPHWFIQGLFA